VLIVHYAVKVGPPAAAAPSVGFERKLLDPAEPIPPGAVWIDMVEPTPDEDQKVESYLGCKVPSRSDPDFAEPSESYYAENGVRYLRASFVSEADNTPDVTEVTFVLAAKTLVTLRYDPGDAFELFGQKLGKFPARTLHPDAVAVGLVNTIIDRSARALNKLGVELDSIASGCFEPRATRARAAGFIPRPSTRSAARMRRSRTCAKAWLRSNGSCCSYRRKDGPRTR
jgi:magnesium transporter